MSQIQFYAVCAGSAALVQFLSGWVSLTPFRKTLLSQVFRVAESASIGCEKSHLLNTAFSRSSKMAEISDFSDGNSSIDPF